MQRNKIILLAALFYIVDLIYIFKLLLIVIKHTFSGRPVGYAIQFLPEGLAILLLMLLFVLLLSVVLGIFQKKRFAYLSGLILAIFSLPAFIGNFTSGSFDLSAILLVAGGVILLANRKEFN